MSARWLLGLVFFAAQASADEYLISNVNVLDINAGETLQHQNVIISDGKIQSISKHGDAVTLKNATVIDGKGLYLMPGLAEMHAHIPPSSAGQRVQEVLMLYLSQGITTIRGMLGESSHLRLRDAVKEGSIPGPRIYTAGPSLNGNSVQSVDVAIEKVKQQHADGYDHLKLHPGLRLAEYNAIVKTAAELDIPLAGHVSLAVGAEHAIKSRQLSIDHMDDFIRALTDDKEQPNPGFFGVAIADQADPAGIDQLAASIDQAGVWVVPTETLMVNLAGEVSLDSLNQQPGIGYMPEQTRTQWANARKNFEQNSDPEVNRKFLKVRRQLLNAIANHGNRLLLGSDAPQIFNVPGFSIHKELALYVDAGLSEQQALVSGTSNVAKYLGVEESRGQVKPGFDADLVLLKGNPLKDIGQTAHVEGVMVAGRWYSQKEIERQLSQIKARYN